ncbi:hypothetical protein C162_00333 [Paenibacillus sp. FSL R7-269]|nr:hypothetical protein C162_00333 [Paenibacillus sp. FSL R7-269]
MKNKWLFLLIRALVFAGLTYFLIYMFNNNDMSVFGIFALIFFLIAVMNEILYRKAKSSFNNQTK